MYVCDEFYWLDFVNRSLLDLEGSSLKAVKFTKGGPSNVEAGY